MNDTPPRRRRPGLPALGAAFAVVVYTPPAWACGQCLGDGSGGSLFGWLAIGAVGLLVYRYFSKS